MEYCRLDEEAWNWSAKRANPIWCADTTGFYVRGKDGEIAACVIFDSWSHNSVNIHMSIDNPMVLRHGLLDEIARFVYTEAGRGVIIGLVPGDNAKALKLNKHIGLKEVHRIRDGYKVGVDMVIMELRKEDCRYGW